MVAGGVLAYLVISPLIVYFGESLQTPVAPGTQLIKDMGEDQIRNNYILYIGAGAVAAGGILSMLKAMPVILGAMFTSFRDLTSKSQANGMLSKRTERDLPLGIVFVASCLLVLALMMVPQLGLGFGFTGMVAALMIVVFGFLFVTVASRLTGEIGSSSNPISGMTVATLLLTCLILLVLGNYGWVQIDKEIKLTALTIAGVVCIASSNGGSTAQALKTGHLVGATPRSQQIAILIGALTSALVVGLVLLAMNEANSTYSKKAVEGFQQVQVPVDGLSKDTVHSGPYATDKSEYYVLNLGRAEVDQALPPGRYLLDGNGVPAYLVDPAINGKLKEDDFGNDVTKNKFDAPKTVLMQLIIDGILDRRLPWSLVLIGVLIAVTLELSGVASLPFAVGVYLPLAASTPIFVGGVVRWMIDAARKGADQEDSSPAMLLSSGYIAGGAIAAVLISFMNFQPSWIAAVDAKGYSWFPAALHDRMDLSLLSFCVLAIILLVVGLVGSKKSDTVRN